MTAQTNATLVAMNDVPMMAEGLTDLLTARMPTAVTGMSWMELVLMALGACTATDIVIVLKKKRQKLEGLEVICSGERAAEPPTVWTKLELVYRLRGELDDAAVKRAIELSEEKYCSVAAMLKKTAKISWRYEIVRGGAQKEAL